MTGPRSQQQVVVTGVYADGTVRDLTQLVDIKAEAGTMVSVGEEQLIYPHQNGVTNLMVKAGEHKARVPVTVRDFDKAVPISFRNDVIAALNVGGCN